jgi:hypothetical protein
MGAGASAGAESKSASASVVHGEGFARQFGNCDYDVEVSAAPNRRHRKPLPPLQVEIPLDGLPHGTEIVLRISPEALIFLHTDDKVSAACCVTARLTLRFPSITDSHAPLSIPYNYVLGSQSQGAGRMQHT